MSDYPSYAFKWESKKAEISDGNINTFLQDGSLHQVNTRNKTYQFTIIHEAKTTSVERDFLINFMQANKSSGFNFVYKDGLTYFCYPLDKAVSWVKDGAFYNITTSFLGSLNV